MVYIIVTHELLMLFKLLILNRVKSTLLLSGSVYINVTPRVNSDSGNLVLQLGNVKNELGEGKNKKSINVVRVSLCFFPSSLQHYTIPFVSEENRIVLAFDVIPKN